jgi:hypothetical protein
MEDWLGTESVSEVVDEYGEDELQAYFDKNFLRYYTQKTYERLYER